MLKKEIFRTIKKSLGRYMSILLIIALGVGFFVGLRITEESMRMAGNGYLDELNLYDFRLISTLGFTEADEKTFKAEYGENNVSASCSADFIGSINGESEEVYHAHTILKGINGVDLRSGRMPEAANECVIDGLYANENMLGSKLCLTGSNSEDTFDTFAYDEYTIVGIVNSAEYINYQRGTTSLAGGKAFGYIYIPADGFSTDYYTEIYVVLDNNYVIYSEQYEKAIEDKKDSLEALLNERADIRYNSLYSDAEKEILDAEKEISDAEKELADGEKKLLEAKAEIADGEAEIADSKKKISDGKAEIEKNRADLAEAEKKWADGKAALDEQWESFNSEKEEAEQKLAANKAQIDLMQMLPEYPAYLAAYEQAAEEAKAKFSAAEQALMAAQAELDSAYNEIENGKAQLIAAEKEIADGEAKLPDAEKKIEDAKAEVAEAEQELADGRIEIEDGRKEVSDAWEELKKLEYPTTYVLDRKSNIGYVSFENDIAIVSGVAKVFPLFFFLVAALVCITTMTRMVGEQRTQNGVLKAMGYSNYAIASQYLVYAGSASLVGCFIGFVVGSRYMPMILWEVYHIMYSIQRKIVFVLDWKLFAIVTILYLICMLGITYILCRRDLETSAAGLMRPESPDVGKRILLERIGFIWKPMKFLHKVTARNIFRYKKRMFMMMIGIGGCTALLMAGLGIRDTIQPILDYQYEEISLYDATALFVREPDAEQREEFLTEVKEYAKDAVLVYSGNMDLVNGEVYRSISLVAYEDNLSEMIDLHHNGKEVKWPGKNEIVISSYVADKLNADVGDEITLVNDDYKKMTATVSGVFENYIGEIGYITFETYEEGFGKAPSINNAYLKFEDGADEHRAGAGILNMDNIASVSIVADMRNTVGSMLSSLDLIVLIVLVCAGALSFIVLFNLTNITITERQREIATLKVLGFYRNEQNSYIFRENIILTIIGTVCGIPLGLALLKYVMSQIKIDGIYFGCRLAPLSYVWAITLTILFTVIVDFALTSKLRRINMAEAMKAIE